MEDNKKRRNEIISAIIAIIIIGALVSFGRYQICEFKKAKSQLQNMKDNLNYVQQDLHNAKNKAMREFYRIDNLIEQYTQTLELANQKLLKVDDCLSQLENCEESEMRSIYEVAKEQKDEARQLVLQVNVVFILSTRDYIVSEVSDTCEREKTVLATVQKTLNEWEYDKLDISDAYNRYNEVSMTITFLYGSTQKTAADIQSKISKLCIQRVLRQIEKDESRLCEFRDIIERYENREEVKQSLLQKINDLEAFRNSDMGKPIGFTEEELRYLLRSVGIVQQRNPEIIDILPRVMVETVKEYPVNELFSIAVMSFETGYFKSKLAIKNFNYGGMMGSEKALTFDNMKDGLKAAIRCVHQNLKGSNTIFEVNRSYCSPTDLNDDGKIEGNEELYHWSYQVMSIMTTYKKAILKELS